MWELETLFNSRILEKRSDVFAAGCSCHLAHLAASAGGQAYQEIMDFDMEDYQVDMYYFFKNSTRRKGILLEYLEFMDQEWEFCQDLSKYDGYPWKPAATKSLKSSHL